MIVALSLSVCENGFNITSALIVSKKISNDINEMHGCLFLKNYVQIVWP